MSQVTFEFDGDTIRCDGDEVEMIRQVPGGYEVTLVVPRGSRPGTKVASGNLRTIELSADEARPLIEYIARIGRRLS